MAYASKNIGTPNPYSSYTAYQNAVGDKWTSTPSTGELTYQISFADLGIPDGSTVNSASITWTWGAGGALHGTALQGITFNGTAYTGASSYSGMAVSAGSSNTLIFRYKSGTSNTSYPAKPSTSGVTNSKINSGYIYFENATLHVYYTLPYTKVNPPTSVSTPTNVLPSSNQTLSWSGASGGTGTSVASYQVYRASTENSNYEALGSQTTSTSMTVVSHQTVGSSYHYRVVANSSPEGYNSDMSSAIASMKTMVGATTAPTSVSVANTNVLPSTTVVLSWSEAGAGTNNAITGYQLYRSTSPSSGYEALGSKIANTGTSGTANVVSHATNGSTYYYKVAAVGTHTGYDSQQSSVYASLTTTITNVGTPTNPSLTPTYFEDIATMSWGAASAGTNNAVASYSIEYQYSSDNSIWGTATTTISTATSKAIDTAAVARGQYLRFRVKAIGTQTGYDSGWSSYSSSIMKNSLPQQPIITYGVAGQTTYNTKPYVKVVVPAEADGHAQELQVKVDSGSYITLKSAIPAAGGTYILQLPTLSVGSRLITFRIVDSIGAAGGAVARTINVAAAVFTDSTLTAGTPVKAAHINELRAQINALRGYYGLSAISWTDTIATGSIVKAIHFSELQAAVKAVADINGVAFNYSPIAKNQRIMASTLTAMRQVIPQL